jgi:hypothetical protein
MKDMTEKQALAKAVRLWGASGTIRYRPTHRMGGPRGRLARYCCTVAGYAGAFQPIQGQGNTWREAFADAAVSQSLNL